MTNATLVTDVDELEEGEYYHFTDPRNPEASTFQVDLKWKDADDFADYGEGSIQFHYRDGYVADLPVSNVERYIEQERIARGKP